MRWMKGSIGVLFLVTLARGGDKIVDFRPLVNDVSLYKNFFDSGASGGSTLQVVSINQIKLRWWFQVEVTADLNRHLNPGYASDYYVEAGVLKYVVGKVAVNYQRVHGTFVGKPINQIGIRYSF
jgi:hypothetical protein